jgi:adenylate cyclase
MTATRILVAAFASVCVLPACRADPNGEPSSIAVLPLSNASPDPAESDYLADGITQAVITRLAQVGLRVTPWESVRRYRGADIEPRTVARELNVDTLLLGTFQLFDDRILTRLTLMEAESGFIAWAEEFEEPDDDIFRMQRQIAQGAASSLKRSLSGHEEEILAAPESQNVEAYDLYLQGAHLMHEGTREATEIAFEYFSRAVELDPALVGAHLGLGAVHNTRYFYGWGDGPSSLRQARESFEKAIALDSKSMVARRGLVMVRFYRGESEAALEQGRLAAQIGVADDLETLLTRAEAYQSGGLPSLSLDLYRRVLEIDPAYPEAHYMFVTALSFARDDERTVEAGNEFLRRFGDDSDVHGHLANAYWGLDEHERAREHFLAATRGELHPWAALAAGLFFHERGERDQAIEIWKRAADSIESNLAANPDHASMRAFLAACRALLSGDPSFTQEAEKLYEAAGYYGWELENVMGARVRLGDLEGAVRFLRKTVRLGRPITYWETWYGNASPPEALRELRAENEALKARYRERYGPDR